MNELKRPNLELRLDEWEVKRALSNARMTQRDLAERIGRSATAVNQAIKHGENAGVVREIASELNVELVEVAL